MKNVESKKKLKEIVLEVVFIVMVLAIVFMSGCQVQDGGLQAHVIKWDNNGLRIGSIETNGSQAAVWKPDEANERFNVTIREKGFQNHLEDIAEKESSLVKELAKQGMPALEIKSLSLTNRLLRK